MGDGISSSRGCRRHVRAKTPDGANDGGKGNSCC